MHCRPDKRTFWVKEEGGSFEHPSIRACHQYLHHESCPPLHQKSTIPSSQALILRRICSQESDYIKQLWSSKRSGRSGTLWNGRSTLYTVDQATSVEGSGAFRKKPNSTLGDRVPLVVTYNPQLPKLSVRYSVKFFPFYMSQNG